MCLDRCAIQNQSLGQELDFDDPSSSDIPWFCGIDSHQT